MAGKKINIEHIRYIPHTGNVCCYHCGDSYQATPCSMGMMIAIMKQYTKDHRRCKETETGKRLYEANVQAFEKLPDNRKDHFATLSYPKPKNLGEKIAQHMMMEEMSKADLGPDLKMELRKEKFKCGKCGESKTSQASAYQCCKEHP